jgi:hypothetical protein
LRRPPSDQGGDQALGGGLQGARAERQCRDLPGRLIDHGIEARHPHDQLPPHCSRLGLRRTRHLQRVQKTAGDLGR